MPTPIDRHELQRLLAEQQAQLIEVLPGAEYEDEHLPDANLVGSDEKTIKGETSFRWLPGGFFLEQRVHIDFMGRQIDALRADRLRPRDGHLPLDRSVL